MARKILAQAKIDSNRKASELTAQEMSQLKDIIEKEHKVEGELRRIVMMNVKRMKDIGCWKGLRHMKKLPVRGQRTKTNARTRKGPRKTVGVVRQKAERTVKDSGAEKK